MRRLQTKRPDAMQHQGGIIYLAKKAKAEKRARLGGRPIDLAWQAEKAAWIEDDLDIEPYLAKGYNTDEGLPKLTELRLGMRMGFDESSYDDPTLPLHIIKKRRVHQLRDWAKEQGLLPPMYYEDPVHGIDKNQLRELLIGIANGIMPDTYGLKLIKLHKCAPRVLREMRLCREAGMTGDQIRPYWAFGAKKLREVRAEYLKRKMETTELPACPGWQFFCFVPIRHSQFRSTIRHIHFTYSQRQVQKNFPNQPKKLLTNRPNWNILMVQTKFT